MGFDLAAFVQTRLAAINSPSVDQELSGSEKSTLADLINHNMGLAYNLYQVGEETILETVLVSLLPELEVEGSSEISSVAKAAHREVVQYRDLLLLQKVETISEAQRTGWNLAASNLSDTAQVALMVNLLGVTMKLTGMKLMDTDSEVHHDLPCFPNGPQARISRRGRHGEWMYTHTVRKEVAGEMVETQTDVSRQTYDQLLAQVPGGKVETYSREEVEAYLAIFDSVTDEMAEGWKEGETNLPVKRRMLDDLNTIIQNF